MTTTPPDAPAGPPPADQGDDAPSQSAQGSRATREELRDLGRIRRTIGADRKVAGVAGGLARHLDIDPIILRVAFVVLVFFGGAGLLLYGACWLLLPEDGSASAPLSLDDRNRSIALIVIGAISVLLVLGDSVGQFGFPWPLALVALVALLVLVFLDRDRKPGPTAPPVPHVPDPGTGTFTPAAPGTPCPSPRRTFRGRGTRAGAARSCSGSPWRWPHSASVCSGSWTWPAPRSPTRRTQPWSSAPAA